MLFGTKPVDSKAEKRAFLRYKINEINHFEGSDPTGSVELDVVSLDDVYDIFKFFCDVKKIDTVYSDKNRTDSQRISYLCAHSINVLTEHAAYIFKKYIQRFMNENDSIDDLKSIFEDQNLGEGITTAKKFAQENIFNEKRKIKLELGAYNIIGTLLDGMVKAAFELHHEGNNISFKSRRILDLMGNEAPKKEMSLYHKYLRVTDYIVGMTDNYATSMAEAMQGVGY